MSFLPNVKGIRKEDLGDDPPSWVDNLLSGLNSFMESIYTIVNGNLSFSENINCKIFIYVFTTLSTYSSNGWESIPVNVKLNNKINGVLLLAVNNVTDNSALSTTAKSIEWEPTSSGVRIKYISGLADSTKYEVRLLII